MFQMKESKELDSYIRRAYESDANLISQWHVIAGSTREQCIEKTIRDLEACQTLQFFVVSEGDEFVGYFGTELDGMYMPTIFILPKFRNRKDEFWALINKKVTKHFLAGIYSKNIPCMRFYSKMGGKELGRENAPDGEVTVFQFNQVGA